jgi:hypothetical protein
VSDYEAIVNLFYGLTHGKCRSEGSWIRFDFTHDFLMQIKSNISQSIIQNVQSTVDITIAKLA